MLIIIAANDVVTEVSLAGKKTLRNADIAQMIKDAGSELQYETLLHVLEQSDRITREQLQAGHTAYKRAVAACRCA